MMRDPMEPTEAGAADSAPHHLSWVQRRVYRIRLGRCLAATAAVVVLFYAVVGYVGSADMFGDHPRWRGMNRGPADFGLLSETVSFDSTDGIPLKAWWLPASGTPRAAVIIAHGIDHTRQVMLPRAAFLVHGGYDVLAIDLRGHGESGGSIVSPGLLEARDILGALRYIRSRGNNEPVALLGISYGAAASLIAAAESPEIAAVISDSSFLTGKDALGRYRPPLSSRFPDELLGTSPFPGLVHSRHGACDSADILSPQRSIPRPGIAIRYSVCQPD